VARANVRQALWTFYCQQPVFRICASTTFSTPLSATRRWWRWQLRGSLPDRSSVELDRHAVRRVYGALIWPINPNASRIIDIGLRRLSCIVDDVELPAILCDICKTPRGPEAGRDALIAAVQVNALNLCRGGGRHEGYQESGRACCPSHDWHPVGDCMVWYRACKQR
jgi:hypothetical protein